MKENHFFIPVYIITLGFLLSLLGMIFKDSSGVHDSSIALISGALGMLTPLLGDDK